MKFFSIATALTAAAAACVLIGCAAPKPEDGPTSIKPIDQAKVAAAQINLKQDPVLAGCELKAAAHNDTLVITGKVPNHAAKAKAEELVRKVEGIKKVENKLEVVPGEAVQIPQ
jgi:hypothetical protein